MNLRARIDRIANAAPKPPAPPAAPVRLVLDAEAAAAVLDFCAEEGTALPLAGRNPLAVADVTPPAPEELTP